MPVAKGTLVRPRPDWLTHSMATCAVAAGGGGGYAWAGLYNNAQDGSSFHIVGVALYLQGSTNGAGITVVQGPPSGSVGNPPIPIRFNEAAPPGQTCYINANGSQINPNYGYLGGWSGGLITTPGWPLWILPATYTIWFGAFQSGSDIGVTLWYLVSKD
jgi:hypothetical protein